MARILNIGLAALLGTALATPVLAADAVEGAKVFRGNCSVCHTSTASASPRMGPTLAGVVGRKAGSQAAYKGFSPAMKASGIIWTPDLLAKYVDDPQMLVRGNRMPFAGLHDASESAAVAAYLATLK